MKFGGVGFPTEGKLKRTYSSTPQQPANILVNPYQSVNLNYSLIIWWG